MVAREGMGWGRGQDTYNKSDVDFLDRGGKFLHCASSF